MALMKLNAYGKKVAFSTVGMPEEVLLKKGYGMECECKSLHEVVVSASKKCSIKNPQNPDELYEKVNDEQVANTGGRKILHTDGFKFLDKVAVITSDGNEQVQNPWRLCTVTQVEEVKCILRLLLIWLCTILYSVVFTQMASLFVEQGAVMKTNIGDFHIPAASMSSFDILRVAICIFIYRRVLDPLVARFRKSKGLSELERMGIGLIIAVLSMVAAGLVEVFRLKYADKDCTDCEGSSSLSIFWQVPQYVLVGASEVFMYVGQLEFFTSDLVSIKSFASFRSSKKIAYCQKLESFRVF